MLEIKMDFFFLTKFVSFSASTYGVIELTKYLVIRSQEPILPASLIVGIHPAVRGKHLPTLEA